MKKVFLHKFMNFILLNDLKNEEIDLAEAFVVGCLIEKLPNSWKDF